MPNMQQRFTTDLKSDITDVCHKMMSDGHVSDNAKSIASNFFRTYGHIYGNSNPLYDDNSITSTKIGEIMKQIGGYTDSTDPDAAIARLHSLYCGSIGVEFNFVDTEKEKGWLFEEFEKRMSQELSQKELSRYAEILLESSVVDQYLANKFGSVKRYSGEGAESALVAFQSIFQSAGQRYNMQHIVIGIPHRGRNNLLMVLLNYPSELYFSKMRGKSEFPSDWAVSGDTFSHFSISETLRFGPGEETTVTVLPNPSHLEAVVPVVAGKTRSKMAALLEGDYSTQDRMSANGDGTLCIQVHGDAAMVGQGVVYETLALANVPHFRLGGSLHLVVNNQLGFTTESQQVRSFRYCTDMAHMLRVPVLHVNGEDPIAVAKAADFCLAYRQRFRKDIFLDMLCYRRWGHNEMDEPAFTQPLMYKYIRSTPSLPNTFLEDMSSRGLVQKDEILSSVGAFKAKLDASLRRVDEDKQTTVVKTFQKQWSKLKSPVKHQDGLTVINSGIEKECMEEIIRASVTVPNGFVIHPTLQKSFVQHRLNMQHQDERIDWAAAEALAVGSLMLGGFPCRISGQDVGRGTFSQRHFMLVNQENDDVYIPLNDLTENGKLEVANTILSEEGVVGFEYGMSLDNPDRLQIWEAQFGDFFNGAQIMFDTFVASGETKWAMQSGLVVLLPHGYDGAGPEHSSCRLERFLQLTDSSETQLDSDLTNMHVVFPTTPAQYFHVLRRQMLRPFRRPLIVVAPKLILRLPEATSSASELLSGSFFRHILSDTSIVRSSAVKRVILCSGKHYYALAKKRSQLSMEGVVALVRLEQLVPFPTVELSTELKRFNNKDCVFVWSQEEHRNMGAWNFVEARCRNLLNVKLQYAGRDELAAPAVGIADLHSAELDLIFNRSFVF